MINPSLPNLRLSERSSLTARLFTESTLSTLTDSQSSDTASECNGTKKQRLHGPVTGPFSAQPLVEDGNQNSICFNSRNHSRISVICNPRAPLSPSQKRDNLGSIEPAVFLESIVQQGRNSLTIPNDFFVHPQEEHFQSYGADLIAAVRSQDTDALRDLHRSGRTLFASNKFGESLLHMACRRGFTEVVEFLIHEADVPLRVRDDYGRTPLHDAAWTVEPNFDLIEILIAEEPLLMFIKDKRGHSPLEYVRNEHWREWNIFLKGKHNLLQMSILSNSDRKTSIAE